MINQGEKIVCSFQFDPIRIDPSQQLKVFSLVADFDLLTFREILPETRKEAATSDRDRQEPSIILSSYKLAKNKVKISRANGQNPLVAVETKGLIEIETHRLDLKPGHKYACCLENTVS